MTLFLYSSLPSLHPCDMKLPNFTRLLYGVGKHHTKVVFFLFLTQIRSFRIQPEDTSPIFSKLNEIE